MEPTNIAIAFTWAELKVVVGGIITGVGGMGYFFINLLLKCYEARKKDEETRTKELAQQNQSLSQFIQEQARAANQKN